MKTRIYKNNFKKQTGKKKKTPDQNQFIHTSRVTKCDICLIASEKYCRLNPATCGDAYIKDNHISLSSGQFMSEPSSARKGKSE